MHNENSYHRTRKLDVRVSTAASYLPSSEFDFAFRFQSGCLSSTVKADKMIPLFWLEGE